MTATKTAAPVPAIALLKAGHEAVSVKEEQSAMFAKVKGSSLDMVELGERMVIRKAGLMAQAA